MTAQSTLSTNQDVTRKQEVPQAVVDYFAAHPEIYADYVEHSFDVARLQRQSRNDLSKEDAEVLAWLLWRARTVRRYTRLADGRVGCSWERALEAAHQRDELHKQAMDARKARQAEREARHDRLESLVLTGEEPQAHDPKASKAELARQAKARRRAA